MEGTRVDGIEKIYMLFGKMISPIEFKYRPYEDCLSKVVVTHSPRYLIDMDLEQGQTIFDKLGIPYNILRNSSNPVKPVIDYYRKLLKPGEEVWWLDQDEPKSLDLIIKLWNNLPIGSRKKIILNAMIFFPEIFSNHLNKYLGLGVWLVNTQGVVCPNIRDSFSAGGQGQITWNGKIYSKIPKIIINAIGSLSTIKELINQTDSESLSHYWKFKFDDKLATWIDLVIENTRHMKLPFDLKKYLMEN